MNLTFSRSSEQLKAAISRKVGLGESGHDGAEDQRSFIVAGDISDYSVGLTLGQVRSFDARGRSPHVRSSRPPIVGPRSRGSLPRLPCNDSHQAMTLTPAKKSRNRFGARAPRS